MYCEQKIGIRVGSSLIFYLSIGVCKVCLFMIILDYGVLPHVLNGVYYSQWKLVWIYIYIYINLVDSNAWIVIEDGWSPPTNIDGTTKSQCKWDNLKKENILLAQKLSMLF